MTRTIMAGLALALSLGAASVADAQQTRRGPRGGDQMAVLFHGIELTAQQKEQLEALREKRNPRENREAMQKRRDEMRALREQGDTAAMRRFREEARAEMQQRHQQMLQDVRALLTPSQREQFEKNLAAAQEKMKERRKDANDRRKQLNGEARR